MNTEILDKWNKIQTVVNVLELDVVKSARGNSAASLRVRKALRQLKKLSHELGMIILKFDKDVKESRRSVLKGE